MKSRLGEVEAKVTLSRAVYLFSIGSNDYTSIFLTNSSVLNTYSKPEYVGIVIGNLTATIKVRLSPVLQFLLSRTESYIDNHSKYFWQDVYKRGGRKFAFINLPPLGCLPGIRIIRPDKNSSCLEEASILAKLHNRALSKLLRKSEEQLKGFKYSLFNFNLSLRRRMNHSSKYGMHYTHTLQHYSFLCLK